MAAAPCVSAQDSYVQEPVTVSKEKVKVGGRLCYSHVVLERQTLYSISKAYGVGIEDIYKYNPSVRTEGLKKNSILLIPVVEAAPAPELKEKSGRDAAEKKPEAQPQKRAAAKKDSPKGSAEGVKDSSKDNQERKVHTVRWFETIETIADKYGVSVGAIMKANGLSGKELKSRQQLVIPPRGEDDTYGARTEETETLTDRQEIQDSGAPVQEAAEAEPDGTEQQSLSAEPAKSGSVRFALVMPFMANSDKPSSSAMDFYCGALLAARELGLDSLNVSIDVFDTGAGDVKGSSLADDDFIIGPLSPSDIRKIHDATGGGKAIISPLDPKAAALTAEFPDLIQVPTPHELQYADLVQWIAEESGEKDRIILVSEKGGKESEAMKSFSEILELSGLKYREVKYSILEGRDILGKLKDMTAGEPAVNRFIIASESEAFVNDAFRNIGLLSREGRRTAVYCHSKVRGYDIEVESLHNNDLHVSLAYYIDYGSPETIRFVKEYRALFNTEPTQFSFQGHDVTKYFCRLKAAYGDAWTKAIGTRKETLLQTTLDFRDGSRINEGVRRIEYEPDYRIVTK